EHLCRKFGEVYYYRNKYEIDAIADEFRVEVKAGKAHRRYPRDVTVLEKEDIPRFLIELLS
ncbi:MAG: ATP-binding protein, partial [Candidatus Asgardarchaeia archaeon]